MLLWYKDGMGLTAEDLRAIVERHAENERWLAQRCRAEKSALAGSALLAHEERGALLDLLRRVAKGPSDLTGLRAFVRAMGDGRCAAWCAMCFALPTESGDLRHAPDCPAPLLETLRQPTPQG